MNGTISKFSYESITSGNMSCALVNVIQNGIDLSNIPYDKETILTMIELGYIKII